MPEGDTIHRSAAAMRAGLVGRRVTRLITARAAGTPPPAGVEITVVEARGKHHLVWFSDGSALHTHMRMTGSWHLYAPHERWRFTPRAARAVIETAAVVAVCFNAPVVELLDEGAVDRHPALRRLGPDLCLLEPDLDAVVARSHGRDTDVTVGELLLDQTVAAGIGNVYKCEVCFLHRLHPWTPAARVDDDVRRALYRDAARLLQRNLSLPRRTTVEGARPGAVWVYGREGRPCRRCGTPIAVERQGDQARVTYWCPRCQPATAARVSTSK